MKHNGVFMCLPFHLLLSMKNKVADSQNKVADYNYVVL